MVDKNRIELIIKGGLRSIAQSNPATGIIAQAWSEYENHKQYERIEELFQSLKKEFDEVKDKIKHVERHILESGEIPSLIESTVYKVKAEHSEKKRRLFAHLLTEVIIVGSELSYDEKSNFIETVDILNEQDIKILSIFKTSTVIRCKEILDSNHSKSDPKAFSNIVNSFLKLESRGLIGEIERSNYSTKGSIGVYPSTNSWQDKWRSKYMQITPTGKTFCTMILEKI